MSGTPIAGDYIKAEGKAGRMGKRMMAIVVKGTRERVYLPPTEPMETVGLPKQKWETDVAISGSAQYVGVRPYGMENFSQLFTDRQLLALMTFSNLIQEAREKINADAFAAGSPKNSVPLAEGGTGTTAVAEAISVYLAIALSRLADYGSSLATWRPKDNAMRSSLPKQAVQMTWDFAEGSPFGESSSGFAECVEVVAKVLAVPLENQRGFAQQRSASSSITQNLRERIISTDPPYYDNVPYADLSDFFYIWLRHSLRKIYPDLFATLAVPKTEELVAFAHRHGNKAGAEAFFLDGMTNAMRRLAQHSHPGFPVTIYYAFKQTESDAAGGTASTGWDTFLGAVIGAGFEISGTWPMRTESDNRQRGVEANALASSIVLVCRPRTADAPTATRREFVSALKAELPKALALLQRGNIAPVDLAQAAIGPGMAVYTRYAKVLDAEGKPLAVREALALINQTLDEALAEQEGDFDADSRWALAWFEQYGFAEGDYGVDEILSKAKNTSVDGLKVAGILDKKSPGGKVRLLRPEELAAGWDPTIDTRLTAWEMVHHLIRVLEAGGESGASVLAAKLGTKAEVARELCYRLYTLCERKKRAAEALSYNGLVQSWPEITRLAREEGAAPQAPKLPGME